MAPAIVWFRLDLRLADNHALLSALQRGEPVIPVFIWSPEEEAPWAPGAASRWWLHYSLAALSRDLESLGSRLIVRSGASLPVLKDLIKESGADALFWNRRYEPAIVARDRKIKETLKNPAFTVESFNASLLFEPWTVQNLSGKPFQVFTPFWKKCLSLGAPMIPEAAPRVLKAPAKWPVSKRLESLTLLPLVDWACGLQESWMPGEDGAKKQLALFSREGISAYPDARNLPAESGTSRLSPHLHFGEVGPRQIWQAIQKRSAQTSGPGFIKGADTYLKEIGWREFAYHLLYHFPKTPQEPLRAEFKKFPWQKNARHLRLWQKGETGYPIVDAGMRELWRTGWMHNRVRMITASFLVKDLLISWQEGAQWFWDTLVDADLANNTLGWQWAAGCGADAAPYYRVFNPILQQEKFDGDKRYARRWIPADSSYPSPMVDHAEAREAALAALIRAKRA